MGGVESGIEDEGGGVRVGGVCDICGYSEDGKGLELVDCQSPFRGLEALTVGLG